MWHFCLIALRETVSLSFGRNRESSEQFEEEFGGFWWELMNFKKRNPEFDVVQSSGFIADAFELSELKSSMISPHRSDFSPFAVNPTKPRSHQHFSINRKIHFECPSDKQIPISSEVNVITGILCMISSSVNNSTIKILRQQQTSGKCYQSVM